MGWGCRTGSWEGGSLRTGAARSGEWHQGTLTESELVSVRPFVFDRVPHRTVKRSHGWVGVKTEPHFS